MKTQQHVVVTGGAGFIGSHLLQELSKNKQLILYCIDDYSAGSQKNHIQGVNYIKGNTKDIDTLLKFTPNMIYHLGQYSRVTPSFQNPNFVWQQNCLGTFKVVEYCRKNKVRLLYSASSTKMADAGEGRNQSPYAWCKATNVELINRYGEWYGLDYVIVYFYNAYGDRKVLNKDYYTLIDIWEDCINNKEKLPIVSPGTQIRNFTYVKDIVQGVIAAGQKGKGDGYQLGAEESYSLYDVAAMFGKTKPQDFEILPPREGDRKTSCIDLTKTINQIGWRPKKKLKDYLAQLLKENSENKTQ